MPFRPWRATFAALPLALLASCEASARRNYAEEVLDDIPGAPVDDDARERSSALVPLAFRVALDVRTARA